MTLQTHTQNHVLGGGKIYWDDGDGYRYLGDTPEFGFTQENENLEFVDSDTEIAVLKEDVVVRITRTGNMALRDISKENIALSFTGSTATQSQSSATGESETLSGVKVGRMYSIGETDANPIGVRKLSNVSVTGSGGTPSHTEGTDYEVNLDEGLIQVLEGGAISDDDDIIVNYDQAGVDWEVAKSGSDGKQEGKLLLVAKNRKGDNTNYLMPKVELQPTGDFATKSREEWQTLTFEFAILEPEATGAEAIFADGVPYTP